MTLRTGGHPLYCKTGKMQKWKIRDVVRVAAMGGIRNVRPTNVLYNALESPLGS